MRFSWSLMRFALVLCACCETRCHDAALLQHVWFCGREDAFRSVVLLRACRTQASFQRKMRRRVGADGKSGSPLYARRHAQQRARVGRVSARARHPRTPFACTHIRARTRTHALADER
eukprot:6212852-Pleurochrysis_carterae.AAC.6